MTSEATGISRRELLRIGVVGAGTAVLGGCQIFTGVKEPATLADPVITARPNAAVHVTAAPGPSVPYSAGGLDALLYVPSGYSPQVPAPLVLMFHGENESAETALALFQPHADAAGLVLLAVDSTSPTWDIVYGAYGPDIPFVNASLAAAFATVNIDSSRVYVEGFADGASYAIAVGRTNGDLFSRVIAFSPGFMPPYLSVGRPTFFLTEGDADPTPVKGTRAPVLSADLTTAGYTVTYVTFSGGHEVPDAIAQQAIAWLGS